MFCFDSFIYLFTCLSDCVRSSDPSCGTQNLCCFMEDLSLRHTHSSCGVQAPEIAGPVITAHGLLLQGMQDLSSWSGIELVPTTLQNRLLTTGPPQKSPVLFILYFFLNLYFLSFEFNWLFFSSILCWILRSAMWVLSSFLKACSNIISS